MLMGRGGGSQHLRPLDPPQGAQKRGSVPKHCTLGGHRRGGEGDIEQSDPDAADGGCLGAGWWILAASKEPANTLSWGAPLCVPRVLAGLRTWDHQLCATPPSAVPVQPGRKL